MAALLHQVKEGAGNIGEVENEPSVEVGKAHKRANIFEFLGGGPRVDSIEFNWVHGEFIGMDNHSEVLHFGGGEFTLLKL